MFASFTQIRERITARIMSCRPYVIGGFGFYRAGPGALPNFGMGQPLCENCAKGKNMKDKFEVTVQYRAMNDLSLYGRLRNAIFEWQTTEPRVKSVTVLPINKDAQSSHNKAKAVMPKPPFKNGACGKLVLD